MATNDERVAKLTDALRRAVDALREVQPQVRGALPADSVKWALKWGQEALDEYGLYLCATCGNDAGVGQVYCEDCRLKAMERDTGQED